MCYTDNDDDRYGAGPGTKRSTACNSGEVQNNGNDCYDYNADVHPGSTYAGTEDRGDGSFDYNCDGTVSKGYPDLDLKLCNFGGWTDYNLCSEEDPTGSSCEEIGYCDYGVSVCDDMGSQDYGDLGFNCGETITNADVSGYQLCSDGSSSCGDRFGVRSGRAIYNQTACGGSPGFRPTVIPKMHCY
jgi:hypothetical protein